MAEPEVEAKEERVAGTNHGVSASRSNWIALFHVSQHLRASSFPLSWTDRIELLSRRQETVRFERALGKVAAQTGEVSGLVSEAQCGGFIGLIRVKRGG